MSTSTRASSDTWKFAPPRRSQRRLPFTECPRPGTSTTSSSAIAIASSGSEAFSKSSVGTQNTSAAQAAPMSVSSSCRSR